MDSVKKTDEEVGRTKDGRPGGVLVSADEFESWRETMAIRFDADLIEEIKSGLESLKNGNASLYTIEELLPE